MFSIKNRKFKKDCPVEFVLHLLSGKWKVLILWHLFTSKKRFGELQKDLKKVTKRMLSKQLKALEKDGFVKRKIFPEVPPRVEYSLTKKGLSLKPILIELCKWGKKNLKSKI